ncbi:hypothetical protein HYFRA_00006818 [Hymenoscyphus fraxineus]|uniref:Uncharacterized protein n=1 Tax=Hymenoscyphus fraxineus TaxID=746836 RepID=A0A9N9KQL3_9HELO|nr:hypothetical protein HYFRA_00006818 [Hymenoscyphus fraxineus]
MHILKIARSLIQPLSPGHTINMPSDNTMYVNSSINNYNEGTRNNNANNTTPGAVAVPHNNTYHDPVSEENKAILSRARRFIEHHSGFDRGHAKALKIWMYKNKARNIGNHRDSFDQLLEDFGYKHNALNVLEKRSLRERTKEKMGTFFREMEKLGAAKREQDKKHPSGERVWYADWCETWIHDAGWNGSVGRPAGWDESVEKPARWDSDGKESKMKKTSSEHGDTDDRESEDERASEEKDIDMKETQKRELTRAVEVAEKALQSAERESKEAWRTGMEAVGDPSATQKAFELVQKADANIEAAKKDLEIAREAESKHEPENYVTIEMTHRITRHYGNADQRSSSYKAPLTPPAIAFCNIEYDNGEGKIEEMRGVRPDANGIVEVRIVHKFDINEIKK